MLLLGRAHLGAIVLSSLCLAPLGACSETPDKGTDIENVAEDDAEDEPMDEADEATPSKPDAGKPVVKPPTVIDAGSTKPPVTPPKADAGSTVRDAGSTVMNDAGVALPGLDDLFPAGDGGADPFVPGDRTPNADNIAECPKVAPENPIGDCLGVPVYATCGYTTYNCICDWYHWICI